MRYAWVTEDGIYKQINCRHVIIEPKMSRIVYCWYSLELTRQDDSDKYPQTQGLEENYWI